MAIPAGAAADDPLFEFGRLAKARPDALSRIGVRVHCITAAGCKLELILTADNSAKTELGRMYTQLLGGTTETNYVLLTKRKIAYLKRRAKTPAVFTANVTTSAGLTQSLTKPVVLRPPKATKKRR